MSITIAIVEDLEEVREGLKNFLSLDPDLLVLGAYQNATEAEEGILHLQPDIVIMDINLPGRSGIDCIREVRKKGGHSQFMMFTIYENDEKVFEALQAGATGYLLKNTDLSHITRALKELHRGGSPMSANIARKLVTAFQQSSSSQLQPQTPLPLTTRETDVLHRLAQGLLYKEIADELSVSVSTIRQHIHRIYEKLHVQNRTEAINKVYRKH
jgi:DNA-binding NarL/FixJ family response regulator